MIATEHGARLIAIRWDEAVAVVSNRNARTIVGLDGHTINVAAAEWRNGASALARIDRWAPRAVVIPEER